MPRLKKKSVPLELGMKLEMTASHAMAESIASLRESIEDKNESAKRMVADLLDTMRSDKITTLTAKAPGGTLYRFTAVSLGEKVKITKA